MSSICNPLSGEKRDYCMALDQQCDALLSGDKKSIKLDLMNGKSYNYTDIDLCRSFLKFQVTHGAVPPGFKEIKRTTGGTTPTTTYTPKSTPSTDLVAKRCIAAVPVGVLPECQRLMSICYSKATGPYQLPTSSGLQTIADQDQCFSLAIFYSKFSAPTTDTTYISTDTKPGWTVNGKTTFAASFARVRFAPNKSEVIHTQKLTLPFHYGWTIKGIKITIAYKLQQRSDSRYAIRYNIYYGDTKVPDKITDMDLTRAVGFGFKAGDTMTDILSFGVTLGNEGDFGNIQSIDIVKL
ncbi:MAG: hypothetical protein HN337_05005 [Deltaproteobacteria bacterium]|jgi:hypothetical protein|nr:hypothetical protein [Deltaproteobacteria bacterium]